MLNTVLPTNQELSKAAIGISEKNACENTHNAKAIKGKRDVLLNCFFLSHPFLAPCSSSKARFWHCFMTKPHF